MSYKREVCYYRSGPIERDPGSSFHSQNHLDRVFTEEFGFNIVGDTFEYLKSQNCPQEVYGSKMKKLRNQGNFLEFCRDELLVTMSLRSLRRKADFDVIRPSPEASGGTTTETAIAWFRGIPKLVIIGPHGEGLLDSNSTFMIRMLTDRYSLVFNTEQDVINFVRKNLNVFSGGRKAIKYLIENIKKENPRINDRQKFLWDESFSGKTLILLGLPGCGKDTQGRMLQDLCGFKFFGSGFELRRLYSKLPHLKESLTSGELAPSWLVINLITQKLISIEKFEPIVFAGTPKMLVEAKASSDAFKSLGRKPTVVVIDIGEELSRNRIKLRRNCDNCEMSFCGIEFVENPICPQCRAPFASRDENMDEKAISRIFGWYKIEVEKTIKYFEDLGLVTHIDGNRDIAEIFNDILEILKKD